MSSSPPGEIGRSGRGITRQTRGAGRKKGGDARPPTWNVPEIRNKIDKNISGKRRMAATLGSSLIHLPPLVLAASCNHFSRALSTIPLARST
jgi:hypothetical protein